VSLTYINYINQAFDESLRDNPRVLLFGLGVGDVGAVFGSTVNLQSKYGPNRVFDIPLSENAVTGMALGLAMQGFRPVMMHQRADFSFTSAEQIINQIAKASYMSGDTYKVPLVIRMVVGRGWGQGPTHAQSPHSIFSNVPGLQVVAPATPLDGYHLMKESITSDYPVIFIEHRWLHQTVERSKNNLFTQNINQARVMKSGNDLTLISLSYGVIECLKIADVLSELDLKIEVINLRSIQPWDKSTVIQSVAKTKKAVLLDTGHIEFGLTGEIASVLYSELFNLMSHPILRFGLPMEPTPSSAALAIDHYPSIEGMLQEIKIHFGLSFDIKEAMEIFNRKFPYKTKHRDQPDVGVVGPF
jgi:pyruvate/2-oxoglutarate/acetoin dehydrogenase E1 component